MLSTKREFKCHYDAVTLNVSVGPKWFETPLRRAVIEPFVDAYNKKTGSHVDPYALRCRTSQGQAVEGYVKCGSAPLELFLVVDVITVKRRHAAIKRVDDARGARLHELLNDSSAAPADLMLVAKDWLNDCDVDTALGCVDDQGRTVLHAAATRGDARLCEELAAFGGGALVVALDDDLNTPISLAAFCGRSLVLEALLDAAPFDVLNEKNKHLMTPLQLACCDDGSGSPAVARLLAEHGADVNARCWDKTPLMAAASGDFYELCQTLVEELGADPMLRNGEFMMAADYCRTQDVAELFASYMDQNLLGNAPTNAPRFVRDPNREPLPPRQPLRANVKDLATALTILGLSELNLDDARRSWRRLVLVYHPDKRPADFDLRPQDEQTAWNTKFHDIQQAYEIIEAHYMQEQ